MKALSILQPWAWLIVHGHKDIENRTWSTTRRGRILVHAGKRYSVRDYEDDREYFYEAQNIILPAYDDIPRGGIVGEVDIVDCVQRSNSEWFYGPYGFVLANAKASPFRPYRGALGFFEVSESPAP